MLKPPIHVPLRRTRPRAAVNFRTVFSTTSPRLPARKEVTMRSARRQPQSLSPAAISLAALSVVTLGLAGAATAAPVTAGLAWRDTSGGAYGEKELRAARATVFVFSSTSCP